MQGIAGVWSGLDARRQVMVVLATVGVFMAVLFLSRTASAPSMALLYAGLEPSAAGEVVSAIEARGVPLDVRGDAIYVAATDRDALRLALAGEGLPATGGSGYELLDDLSGFGTTSQMFDAAYWRAKEGELARTILASPRFRSARVHIGRTPGGTFRDAENLTASVTVGSAGGSITNDQAKALKYLVGSAVAGLDPSQVSVIDGPTGRVFAGDPDNDMEQAATDRAAVLRAKAERLLEARVGPGRALVEISLETVTESEQITERIFDPEGRVAISTDVGQETSQGTESPPGVTVASNLPAGDGAEGGGGSSNQSSRTSERTNYEVSETQRSLVRVPGAIRRLTAAVLVDGVEGTDANGQPTVTERSAEELEALRDLVANAVGFDEARGDQITIMSMAFTPPEQLGTEASGGVLGGMHIDAMSLAQSALLALVALGLGMFVVRPILTSRPQVEDQSTVPALPSPGESGEEVLTGEIETDVGGDLEDAGLPALDSPGFAQISSFPAFGDSTEDPVERLKSMIEDRHDETVGVLRGWMESDEGAS